MNEEIKRLQEAIKKTKSPYLKRDYQKRIERIKKHETNSKRTRYR